MGRMIPLVPFHPVWDGVSIPSEQWHFYRRLYERYGIVLRPGEYSRLYKKAVVEKKDLFVHARRGRIHRIFLHGAQEHVFVVVGKRVLITALEPGAAHKKKKQYASGSTLDSEVSLHFPDRLGDA